jgi:hypothetical protein
VKNGKIILPALYVLWMLRLTLVMTIFSLAAVIAYAFFFASVFSTEHKVSANQISIAKGLKVSMKGLEVSTCWGNVLTDAVHGRTRATLLLEANSCIKLETTSTATTNP